MSIASLAIKALAPKAKAFEEATKNPLKSQEKVLFEYIRRNKNTEYGLKYNFSKIKSIDDYQRLVPLSDCESLHPYIERMAKGQSNILTKDKPIFFSTTSGTTSKPKIIPLTEYSLTKKLDLMELWSYYIYRDHPHVLDGKILAIVGRQIEYYTESGLVCGSESGYTYKNSPLPIRHLYILPYELFDLMDFEARYYCILRIGMEHNITTLATLNPSIIVILCEKIKTWKEKIINDIETGTLDKSLNMPPNLRKKIERLCRPNPNRANQLKRILKEKGELLPRYFWPNLKLIECWKGGTMRLYLKEFPLYFGNTPIRDIGCLSTEARSSIPMSDEGAGGVLAINSNFYEFIPKDDIDKTKNTLLCDQLDKDKEYFLVITTPGGLYRYDIDDIISVRGFFNKTPIIEFIQKGLHASSLAGEKLYESQISQAVNNAVDKNKLLLEFFSASIQWERPPRYIFLIEFNGEPSFDKKKTLLKSIEEELYNQNKEYEYIRKVELLKPPILKVMKKGEFERYRERKIKEGSHDSQFKTPELSPDFDFQKNFDIEEEINLD